MTMRWPTIRKVFFCRLPIKLLAPPASVLKLALVHLTLRLKAQATDANESGPVFIHSVMSCDLLWRPK